MKPIQCAGCVIVDEQERLLLLHRAGDEIGHWELPGGKLKPGEVLETTAVRELKEELGVGVRLVKALGSAAFEQNGNSYEYHWFHAVIESGEPLVQEPHVHDDLDYLSLDDMASSALSPNMQLLLQKFWSSEVTL